MAKQKFDIKKHVMTGISYMIPIVVCGGILSALAKGFGGYDIGSAIEAGATPFSIHFPGLDFGGALISWDP